MWCLWDRGEAYTGFWWGNLKGRDHLGDPGVEGGIILRCIFRKWAVGMWTGSNWLRIGTGGGSLVTAVMNLHKMRGISWLAENLLASQEGHCSVEWVSKYGKCRKNFWEAFIYVEQYGWYLIIFCVWSVSSVVYSEKSNVLEAHLFHSAGERVQSHIVNWLRPNGAPNCWKGLFHNGHSTVLSVSFKGI